MDNVEAATKSVQETMQSLLTLPFLGGSKLVWLKNASFLADSVAGRSESVLEALERLCGILIAGLPDGVTFLLSAPLADKRRAAFKSLSKLAATQVHDLPDLGFRGDEEGIVEWTTSRVRERNLQLDPEAIEILAARVGLDTFQLESELEKLETAFGNARPVTADDVRIFVPQTREGGIFDLSDAIAKRDLPLALETLDQLLRQGERGVGILLAAIVPTVRNLLLAKDLLVRHRLPTPSQPQFFAGALKRLSTEATSHLPRKKDGTISAYLLGIAAINAAHYSLANWRKDSRHVQQRKPATLGRIADGRGRSLAPLDPIAIEENVTNPLTSQDIVVNSQKRVKAPQCVAQNAVPFKIR